MFSLIHTAHWMIFMVLLYHFLCEKKYFLWQNIGLFAFRLTETSANIHAYLSLPAFYSFNPINKLELNVNKHTKKFRRTWLVKIYTLFIWTNVLQHFRTIPSISQTSVLTWWWPSFLLDQIYKDIIWNTT